VALRYNDRATAIGDFNELSVERAAELAARYDLDYLVAETDLPLRLAYRNARFKVYSLTP